MILFCATGMDEKNERKVWDMLLEVCREHQAQYFYMAPKFPYNLPFDNQVRFKKNIFLFFNIKFFLKNF